MQIEVLVKVIYGKERFYPVSPDSKILCEILGRPTLTKEHLLLCKKGAWEVIVKVPDYKLEGNK